MGAVMVAFYQGGLIFRNEGDLADIWKDCRKPPGDDDHDDDDGGRSFLGHDGCFYVLVRFDFTPWRTVSVCIKRVPAPCPSFHIVYALEGLIFCA